MKKFFVTLWLTFFLVLPVTSAATDEWHISDSDSSIPLYESKTTLTKKDWQEPDFNFYGIRRVIVYGIYLDGLKNSRTDETVKILQEDYFKSAKKKGYELKRGEDLKAHEESPESFLRQGFEKNDIKIFAQVIEWNEKNNPSTVSVTFNVRELFSDRLVAIREYKGEKNSEASARAVFKQICKDFFSDLDKKIRLK